MLWEITGEQNGGNRKEYCNKNISIFKACLACFFILCSIRVHPVRTNENMIISIYYIVQTDLFNRKGGIYDFRVCQGEFKRPKFGKAIKRIRILWL